MRYCYHKLRQLSSPSQVPTVKFHCRNGEESVLLLDESAAAAATADDNEEDVTVDNNEAATISNEILDYDQIY